MTTYAPVRRNPSSLAECGSTLMGYRKKMHDDWFDLQAGQLANERQSLLSMELLEKIAAAGDEALKTLISCNRESEFYGQIEEDLRTVRAYLMVSDKVWREGKRYLRMGTDSARLLVTEVINRLTNRVHLAGQEFYVADGEIGGCHLPADDDLRALNKGAIAYCRGALKNLQPRYGKRKAEARDQGETIFHQIGEIHKATIEFQDTPDDYYDVTFHYVESGHTNWAHRRERIFEYLERKGLTCEKVNLSGKCDGALTEDEITDMAVYLSQTPYIELVGDPQCTDKIMDFIEKQTRGIIDSYDEPFEAKLEQPRDWGFRECEIPKEEYEEYEEDRLEKYSADAAFWRTRARDHVRDIWAWEHPCVYDSFEKFDKAFGAEQSVSSICDALEDIDAHIHRECLNALVDLENELTREAEQFLERCPPLPIIARLEAEGSGWFLRTMLKDIRRVCTRVDDQGCLSEIEKAISRDEHGVKQQLLLEG